jgi:hypothetical protein
MNQYEPESHFLLSLPDFPKMGVYVDLGCGHPIAHSQTHFVRDLGWKGVAVDGNPDYWQDWKDRGLEHCFVSGVIHHGFNARFAIHENSQTSRLSPTAEMDHPEKWGINRIVEQKPLRLGAILEERGIEKIDLLTIDLEGAEWEALTQMDMGLHNPTFIISEFKTESSEDDYRVLNSLMHRRYEVIWINGGNIIYRKKP